MTKRAVGNPGKKSSSQERFEKDFCVPVAADFEGPLREAYLAQAGEDGGSNEAIAAYIAVWEDTVAKLGKRRALALYWRIMKTLPRERRSKCDPYGN